MSSLFSIFHLTKNTVFIVKLFRFEMKQAFLAEISWRKFHQWKQSDKFCSPCPTKSSLDLQAFLRKLHPDDWPQSREQKCPPYPTGLSEKFNVVNDLTDNELFHIVCNNLITQFKDLTRKGVIFLATFLCHSPKMQDQLVRKVY